jgi:S-adenosylmethionine synthetase
MTDRDLCKVIRANFSLSPGSILRDLDLLKPKYYESAR